MASYLPVSSHSSHHGAGSAGSSSSSSAGRASASHHHGHHIHDLGDDDEDFPGTDPHSPTYFSYWVTVAFTLNYILGSGFLTLPWGFHQTGVLLGTAVLVVFAFFSVQSTFFILEAVERANILNKAHLAGVLDEDDDDNGVAQIELATKPQATGPKPLSASLSSSQSTAASTRSAHTHTTTRGGGGADEVDDMLLSYQSIETLIETNRRATIEPQSSLSLAEQLHSGEEEYDDPRFGKVYARKLELTELCSLFLGDRGRQAYSLTLIVYMYGTLWAYATVFANSFAAHLSLGSLSYYLYLLLFALVVVPFSQREFSEQVTVQVVLSVFRIVMVSAMVLTTLVAWCNGHNEFGESSSSAAAVSDADALWTLSPRGLHLLMPVAAYAYIFHHSIPSLAHNVRDKSSLTSLFQTALVVSMFSYIGVGAIVSLYFGEETLSSSNLNWTKYLAFIGNNGGKPSTFARILSFFVVLFPAIDVASAYPLNAFTLGNNIMCAYYGRDTHKHDQSRWQLRFFRLVAAVPPLFGALLFSDLGKITDFTGLTAFGLAFVFPPLLSFFSQRKLEALHVDAHTIHTSVWTSLPFQVLLCVSGAVLFLYVGSGLFFS